MPCVRQSLDERQATVSRAGELEQPGKPPARGVIGGQHIETSRVRRAVGADDEFRTKQPFE